MATKTVILTPFCWFSCELASKLADLKPLAAARINAAWPAILLFVHVAKFDYLCDNQYFRT